MLLKSLERQRLADGEILEKGDEFEAAGFLAEDLVARGVAEPAIEKEDKPSKGAKK